MKKKLNLENLKVQSFVTGMPATSELTVKGGLQRSRPPVCGGGLVTFQCSLTCMVPFCP